MSIMIGFTVGHDPSKVHLLHLGVTSLSLFFGGKVCLFHLLFFFPLAEVFLVYFYFIYL